MIVTHVPLSDIDNLQDIFANMREDGSWGLPDWLNEWKLRLESANALRWKPWPFAAEIIPRSVERQELIDKQYAHLPPKVTW